MYFCFSMRITSILFLLFICSCSYPEISSDKLVYENNFENNDLKNIDGGILSSFNNSIVLGDFNNDGFTIHIDDVGSHDYIFISFDLYIHGSWDGNFNGDSDSFRVPDKWIMELNPEMKFHNDPSYNVFETTFSNSPCFGNYCLKQSYPENYPFSNNPKTGSIVTDLPRKCLGFFGGPSTTLYKIEKGFRSSGNAVVLRFYDQLFQPNAIDKDGIPKQKCDESWSIDNISIRVIKYE